MAEQQWPQPPTLAEPPQASVLSAMIAFPEIVANGSYAGGGFGAWSYALPTSEKGRYGTLGIMAHHLCTEGHTPTAAAWAVYWLAKRGLIVQTGETVADGESWCVTMPALLDWWRKGCPIESLGDSRSTDKRDGHSESSGWAWADNIDDLLLMLKGLMPDVIRTLGMNNITAKKDRIKAAAIAQRSKGKLQFGTPLKEALSALQQKPFELIDKPGQGYFLNERGIAVYERLKKSGQSRR